MSTFLKCRHFKVVKLSQNRRTHTQIITQKKVNVIIQGLMLEFHKGVYSNKQAVEGYLNKVVK